VTQIRNLHLILKPLAWPRVTAWPDTHLCCGWSSYGAPLSCVLLQLHSVVLCLWPLQLVLGHPGLALSFFMWFGDTFPLLQIRRSKVLLLLFKLLLDVDGVSVRCTEQGDVQELHLILDVSM